jgi:phage shock protein C
MTKKGKFQLPKGKLTKSKNDKIIAGVLGGIAEFFKMDPTLVRIIWLVVVAFTGFIPGIITYAVAAMIIPKK